MSFFQILKFLEEFDKITNASNGGKQVLRCYISGVQKEEFKCEEGLEETQGSCPEVHLRRFQSKEMELIIYVTGSFLFRQLIETWEPD